MTPQERESYAANHVIQEAQSRVGFWVAFDGLEIQDIEAATLAVLMTAAQTYAERTGVNWKRLIEESTRQENEE